MPTKAFVYKVLRRSRAAGSVLQRALCYLEVVRVKIPELVKREKMVDGVRGEPDLLGKFVPSDLEAEEWRELSLDSVMADSIWMPLWNSQGGFEVCVYTPTFCAFTLALVDRFIVW
jgi:PHO85 cyclin-5